MKTCHLILYLTLALGFISNIAAADPSPADYKRARARYREGTRCFNIGSYVRARDAYLSAFALVPISEFLLNAALAQRRLGDSVGALETYRRYLEHETSGDGADVAKAYIASVETQKPEPDRVGAQATPATESESAIDQARARALQQERDGFVPAPVSVPEQHSEPKPLYQRWWLWTTIGGVVVAGLAIGLGVGLTREHPVEFSPSLPTFGSATMRAALRF